MSQFNKNVYKITVFNLLNPNDIFRFEEEFLTKQNNDCGVAWNDSSDITVFNGNEFVALIVSNR